MRHETPGFGCLPGYVGKPVGQVAHLELGVLGVLPVWEAQEAQRGLKAR